MIIDAKDLAILRTKIGDSQFDVYTDGKIDSQDVLFISSYFTSRGFQYYAVRDLNSDMFVEQKDLDIINAKVGHSSPKITLTTASSTYSIGQSIPIRWSYTGASRSNQIVYGLKLIQANPVNASGVGGGTGQSSEIAVGSGSGSTTWTTGGGFLSIPGTYDVFASVNQCGISGCSTSIAGKIIASTTPIRITIVSTVPIVSLSAPIVSLSAILTSVAYGGNTSLSWTSSGATSCKFTEGDANFMTNEKTLSGSYRTTGYLYASQRYTLSCIGLGGTTTKSVIIVVDAPIYEPGGGGGMDGGSGGGMGSLENVTDNILAVNGMVKNSIKVASSIVSLQARSFSGSAHAQSSGDSVSSNCVSINVNLHRGAETPSVNKLQQFLINKGLLASSVTGFYGDKTIDAVKAYQESTNIKITGMVYGMTRQAIKDETCQ